MSSKESNPNQVRMELKYCEQCGGLWVRERGAGVVFCEKCQVMMDELPMHKKRAGRVKLPRLPHSLAEDISGEFGEPVLDLEAAGGVA